jgi:tRNA (cmo5U34)-methyltransferase
MGGDEDRSAGRPLTWAEDDSKIFVEFGRAMVPGREEIEQAFLDLIPAEPDESFLAVEIGTGSGWLSAAVLREFPKARILGLDGSPEMLGTAAQLLGHYAERAELRQFRLEEPSWVGGLPQEEGVRVFLSSLVLHHLDAGGKQDLFRRLFDRLEPGGALLIADLMAPRTERARDHFAAAWEEEIRRRSVKIHGDSRAHEFFVRERWNIYDYPDPVDKPSTLPEQLGWMEEAGFEGVDVFWARAGHALLGGYKPYSSLIYYHHAHHVPE